MEAEQKNVDMESWKERCRDAEGTVLADTRQDRESSGMIVMTGSGEISQPLFTTNP